MKIRILLIVNAIVLGASGLFAILLPAGVMSLYGVESGPAVNLMAQYAGLGSVAVGLIAWLCRNIEDSLARKTIVPAFLMTYVIGIVISVLGTVSGIMKVGWAVVGIYSLFAAVYTYFLFIKKK